MTTIDRQFEQFRKSFPYRNVMVYENVMVYRTVRGMSDTICKEANELIGKLKLPLTASSTTLPAKDSVSIIGDEI